LRCLEILLGFFSSGEIVNWEMHNVVDSSSSVDILSSSPVDVEVCHFSLSLEIEDGVDARIENSFDIVVSSWVCSSEDVGITNLVDIESLEEISVVLVNEPINKANGISVLPVVWIGRIL
jgi:hypothetical protein